MRTTKEIFAELLGIDPAAFEPAPESTDKRVTDLEAAMDILLSGEVNDNA